MRQGLDEVDWAGLTHAYGPADDVPALIRALLSPDADVRGEVRHELYSCIAHQGTRYPATAPAVPFLLELAADSATPDRGQLVDFLEFVATGDGQPTWRRYPIGELRAAGPSSALAAYDAVAEGVPLFAALVGDADAEIAVPAAQALAVFPEHAGRSSAALADAADDDEAPVALATMALLGLGAVAPAGTGAYDEILRRRMRDDDGGVRWAAALAAARLRRPGLLPEALAELRRWAAALVHGKGGGAPWYGIREDLALEELAEIDPDGHDERVRPILDRLLGETPSSNWHNHLLIILEQAGLLSGAAPDRGPVPLEALDVTQRRLVEQLCERPDIFAGDDALMPLGWAGLPDTLAALRQYAGR
ncbi:hypothetical protein [Dactylosporangium sp. CA-139066]|uniref:hypothetical protein n=1 Tax=Dactylosporangium sp. CA-139066 TaxID=3239930 RepID=UPI003D925B76